MRITCVIQARVGSSRFPGKVLAEINGLPLLAFMLERLRGIQVDALVIATSTAPRDDPVAELAHRHGVSVSRGPEADVLARFARVIEEHPCDYVIRLTADCPLTDRSVVATALAVARSGGADYISNTLLRTFPDGLDVEVAKSTALIEAARDSADPAEREHVMPFLYRRPERFRLDGFATSPDLAHLRWTVDTPDDLMHLQRLLAGRGPLAFSWTDLIADENLSKPSGFFMRVIQDVDAAFIEGAVPVTPEAREIGHLLATDAAARSDLARRAWIIEESGIAVAWCQVPIKEGVGTLHLGVASRDFDRADFLSWLPRSMGAQLSTLDASLPRQWHEDARACGFTEIHHGLFRWRRS